jgi:dTDP-4-dehydrorhamnose 3,5-epimerase
LQIQPTTVNGVLRVEVDAIADERGLFARTFDADAFARAEMPTTWPQCNTSWNAKRGTLRGMHFQKMPRPEPKLVRCTRGRIFDVAVDLRPTSHTFCRWTGVELSHDRRNALYVPPGCAHGFLTLEDDCEVLYMMGEVYVPDLASGVRWNDPAFAIKWPFDPIVVSQRDANYPSFRS